MEEGLPVEARTAEGAKLANESARPGHGQGLADKNPLHDLAGTVA
jgi:hypothetical protein